MQQPGQRIVVVGDSGSGKTYVAQRLAKALQLEYICNDALIWRPNWVEVPRDERVPCFDEATRGDRWVIDGNLAAVKDPEDRLVLGRADTVVWLDLPRREVWPQVIFRTFKRAATGEDLWHGNRESWRQSFFSRDSIILWSVRMFNKYRQRHAAFFADPQWDRLTRIRLGSRREVGRWLEWVEHETPCP